MCRIQIVNLDTLSEDEETGDVIISKHEMQSRFGWLSSKVIPQVKQEAERMETIKDEVVRIQNTQEGQPGDVLTTMNTLKVMEGVEDDRGEMNKEQENDKEQVYHIDNKEESSTKPENLSTILKQEIEQLTTAEVTRDIKTTEAKTRESDTPVKENKEAMLPQDGILLTYILKRSQEDVEMQMVYSPTRQETKTTDSIVDIPMSDENHEISENPQKSNETEKLVEDIAVILSMSQPVMEHKEISEEEPIEIQPVKTTMFEKLTKVVNNLGSEVSKEKSLKFSAIDLMLRIQAALDECGAFPENSTVNILDIINIIPDKSAVAWMEKLEGRTEIDSCETKTLGQSIAKEIQTKDEERKQEAKDTWVMQKCTKILHKASKTYKYASKTAAGLADLAGMCDGGKDFKAMMNIVVRLPGMIQQEAEAKVKEAEERKLAMQVRTEMVSIKNLDQLLAATVLLKFKEDWEDPEFEPTKYMVAIFEYWLRKGMFLEQKPNIHSITVKFRCSHTQDMYEDTISYRMCSNPDHSKRKGEGWCCLKSRMMLILKT